MKILRYLLAFAICLAMTGLAHADAIDFQMNVLDPAYVPGKTSIISSKAFSVTFHPCTYYGSSLPSSLNGDLCFEGINATEKSFLHDEDTVPDNDGGEVWNSLFLTFTNPILGGCSALTAPLGTKSIFASAVCTKVGSTYELTFGGGGAIVQGEVFLIAEKGDTNPADFAGATARVTSTPEPGSLVLLSSGTVMLAMLAYTERRKLRLPVRS